MRLLHVCVSIQNPFSLLIYWSVVPNGSLLKLYIFQISPFELNKEQITMSNNSIASVLSIKKDFFSLLLSFQLHLSDG